MHPSQSSNGLPTVFVVDPDPSTGSLAKSVLDGFDVRVEAFSNGHSFLEAVDATRAGCVVLEQRIPDISGFQLLRRLAASRVGNPLVFALANANVSVAVELLRAGALHVLEKPLRPIELLDALQEALELDQTRRIRCARESRLEEFVSSLTRKEREVLDLIGRGRSVKSIAAALDLTVRAIEQRRRSLMEKLGIQSPTELLRFSIAMMQTQGRLPAVAAASGWTRGVTLPETPRGGSGLRTVRDHQASPGRRSVSGPLGVLADRTAEGGASHSLSDVLSATIRRSGAESNRRATSAGRA